MNRATLNEKVTKALSQRSLGALLVCGPDNVQYLTGVCLPMLPVLPRASRWWWSEPAAARLPRSRRWPLR